MCTSDTAEMLKEESVDIGVVSALPDADAVAACGMVLGGVFSAASCVNDSGREGGDGVLDAGEPVPWCT